MKAMDCADYIIDYSLKCNFKITNLQLQKALYCFAAEYIRLTNKYPYDKKILAWNYGPTILNVYQEYKKWGTLKIKKVSSHSKIDLDTIEIINNYYDINDIDDIYQSIVKKYLKTFLETPIFKIVDFTREQSFYKKYEKIIYKSDKIVYPIEEIHLNGMTLSQFLNMEENKMEYTVNDNLIEDIDDLFYEYGEILYSWEVNSFEYESGFLATLVFNDCEVYLDGVSLGYKVYDIKNFPYGDKPFKELMELLKTKGKKNESN